MAVVAQELAALCDLSPEAAFVAGMLHDIGKLGLYVLDPAAQAAVSGLGEKGGTALAHEARVFGLNHCELGGLLAEHWELPQEIVSVVRTHHDDGAVAGPLQALVSVAETLAVALNLPPSPANQLRRVNPAAIEALGLRWDSEEMLDCYGRCRARCLVAARAAHGVELVV